LSEKEKKRKEKKSKTRKGKENRCGAKNKTRRIKGAGIPQLTNPVNAR
jgi:hypothetical protein